MEQKIQTIVEAIQKHKPIEFEYLKDGKPLGKRIGDPHAIFEGTTKEGEERIYVHIVQTGGVSSSIDSFPDWRMFIIDHLDTVKILNDQPSFTIHERYNPHSPMYTRAISKI